MAEGPSSDERPDGEEVETTKGKKYDVMVCENCKQEVVITEESTKSGSGEGELHCCGKKLIRKIGG
jgi:hypothetical protein